MATGRALLAGTLVLGRITVPFVLLCAFTAGLFGAGTDADAEAAYEHGKTLFASGTYMKAVDAFTEAMESTERRCLALANRGRANTRLGKYSQASSDIDSAMALANNAIQDDPMSAQLLEQRAWVHIVKDELLQNVPGHSDSRASLRMAAADLTRAIHIDPKRDKSLELQVFVLGVLGRWEAVLKVCDQALAGSDNDIVFLLRKGNAHLEMGDCRESLDLCHMVLDADPHNVEALYLRSRVFHVLKLWRNALEDLSTAIAIEPKNADLYTARARVYFLDQKQRQGVLDLEKAVKCNPSCIADELTLSHYMYCSLSWQGSISQPPGGTAVPGRTSWVLTEGVMPILNRICASAPKQAECYLMRAWASLATDVPEQAWTDYQTALRLGVSDQGEAFAESVLQFYNEKMDGVAAGGTGEQAWGSTSDFGQIRGGEE